MSEMAEFDRALQAMWDRCKIRPMRIHMSTGELLLLARFTMRKRQFRRWRGRFRAKMRGATKLELQP